MIRVIIQAGFGNQLFQYAAAYALAKEIDCMLELDISFFEYIKKLNTDNIRINNLNKLNLDSPNFRCKPQSFVFYRYASKITFPHILFSDGEWMPVVWENVEKCRENQEYLFDRIKRKKKGIVYGFWQNICYFDKYIDDLRRQFKPNYILSSEVKHLLDEIRSRISVGVHIRRGDFVRLGWNKDTDYYIQGMKKMRDLVDDPHFYVVTDDVQWADTQFGKNEDVTIIDIKTQTKDVDEFFLLSSCKHQIISESTFGWWAAYLNRNENKRIIIPKDAKGDIFLKTWYRI